MMLRPFCSAIAAAAVLAVGASAQITFESNIGTPLGAGDDSISAGNVLGFNFRFPDGAIVSSIDIDSNGRVLPPGGDTSDYSESVVELLAEASSICPNWDDLDMSSASADDVYFNALPGKAVITWKDAVRYGATDPFTIQVQLFADHRIAFVYDRRVPIDEPIVGVSAGHGAVDPGEVDLSAGVTGLGNPNLYEDFVFDMDLAGSALEFVPDGLGGYDVAFAWLPFAAVHSGRAGCIVDRAITLTPNAIGGYDVQPGGAFDATFRTGTPLGLGDDDLSGALPLGFVFPTPGGGLTTDIEVDSNGRLIEVGTDASDFSESVGELLTNPGWSICPLWNDLDPTSLSGSGEVWFVAGSGTGEASVTWDRIVQFGLTVPVTFQVRLFADGSMQFAYRNAFDIQQTNMIVGVSSGHGAIDPGEVDLSVPSSSGGVPVVYEFFDVVNLDVVDLAGSAVAPPTLDALTLPVIGTSFDLDVSNDPAGTLAHLFLVGLPIQVDLGSIVGLAGLDGCYLLSDGLVVTAGSPLGTPLSLPLPNDPNLIGLSVELQAATLSPGYNPFGMAFSDSKVARLGL